MTCPHEIDVGAYVLDALEPAERLRVRAHIERCAACAAELRALEGLPALLATVPAPEAVPSPPVPSELAFSRLRRSAVEGPAPAGRTPSRPVSSPAPGHGRRWLLVAAAAVLLGVGGVTAAVATGDRTAPTTVAATSGSLSVHAAISASGTGSRIALSLAGVPAGQRCELTVQARDGHWETASVWTADYVGDAHVTGTVHIRPGDLRRLVVRTLDGRTLVSMTA